MRRTESQKAEKPQILCELPENRPVREQFALSIEGIGTWHGSELQRRQARERVLTAYPQVALTLFTDFTHPLGRRPILLIAAVLCDTLTLYG